MGIEDKEKEMDLSFLNFEVIEEILLFRSRQSKRLGYDIGTKKAAEEWIEHYYETWLKERLSGKLNSSLP